VKNTADGGKPIAVLLQSISGVRAITIIKLKSLFVCLNALILGTTDMIRKILLVLDSPFIEEGYRLWYRNTLISALHPCEAGAGFYNKKYMHLCGLPFENAF
jgi:hypothetical protein